MGRCRGTRLRSWQLFFLGTSFPGFQHCVSGILKAGADLQPGNQAVSMGLTPPAHSLFNFRHCGIRKTQPTGIGCTRELWETLPCLRGKGGEDTVGCPRWKQTCRFGSSSLPRESEGDGDIWRFWPPPQQQSPRNPETQLLQPYGCSADWLPQPCFPIRMVLHTQGNVPSAPHTSTEERFGVSSALLVNNWSPGCLLLSVAI